MVMPPRMVSTAQRVATMASYYLQRVSPFAALTQALICLDRQLNMMVFTFTMAASKSGAKQTLI